MATQGGFRRIVARRLVYLTRVREIAQEAFHTMPEPSYCVRRMEVVNYVATRLRRPAGARLCADVRAAVAGLGWGAVDACGRAYFSNVKPKNVSDDKALKASREDKRRAKYGPE